MSDLGGLPKLPAACSQCGEHFWKRACGPTHAVVWQSIRGPVLAARRAERAKVLDLVDRGEQLRRLIVRAAAGPETGK